MTTSPQKITFGEFRESGVRDVLIYSRDHRCTHHVEANADGWADDVRLSDIEDRFVCQVCGRSVPMCGPPSRPRKVRGSVRRSGISPGN